MEYAWIDKRMQFESNWKLDKPILSRSHVSGLPVFFAKRGEFQKSQFGDNNLETVAEQQMLLEIAKVHIPLALHI